MAEAKRPSRSVLQTLFGIMFLQAQDSQAGAVGLLGMGSAVDDLLDQSSGVRAGLLGPADDSGGSPFEIVLVRQRHMLFDAWCDDGATKLRTWAGHALAFLEGLHGMGSQPHFEFFALAARKRHAVVMFVDFDVVVDVDGGDFPLGVFVEISRAVTERWADRRAKRVRGGIV